MKRCLRITLVLTFSVAALAAAGCGGGSSTGTATQAGGNLQTISFQRPTNPGPQPFTQPADVSGSATVPVQASGPFGGTGSNQVCDRDLLIRFLTSHPDRMRAWAGVEGIDPSADSVSHYIAGLHPVTLTRDTQVTNHTFENGQAIGFQAILQAGTAVLVDKYGRPVARCRCGNPLTEPTYYSQATCQDCPAHYHPPTYSFCRFWYHPTDYSHDTYPGDYYSNQDYDKQYISWFQHGPWVKCYAAYPDPPPVTVIDIYSKPSSQQSAPGAYNPPPSSSTPPSSGSQPPTNVAPYNNGSNPGGTTGGSTGGGTTGGQTTGGETTGGTTGGGTTGGNTTGGGTTGGTTGGDTTGGSTGGGTTGGGTGP